MKFATAAEERAYQLGSRQARSLPHSDPKPVYHQNANGSPEYGTIQIVMDHLMDDKEGHVVTKLVLDTRNPEQALRRLWDYYGETANLLALNSTLDILMEARQAPQGMFLYVVPAEVGDRFGGLRLEVLMGTDVFSALSRHPDFGGGSEFVLIQKLTEMAAKIMADVNKSRGGFPPLTYIGLDGQLVATPPAALDTVGQGEA